ncbi:hypothetical protein [uncultured Acinetobacter sp.]|uniref:hypothetical protein n=1 Tax=uncultured Acinetobacter sp. TaxID=165433 RepID=UPI00262313DB|nr:hypothetical protein [uncultured Acinetobacter sp.]
MKLFLKMILTFLFIFISIWFFATYVILPISMDKGATLASCLSMGATLYAAVVAYLLVGYWKVQHRENLKSNYFQKIFNKYVDLKNEISTLQNLHDSWLEEIYSNHGEITDFDDGGLIKQIFNVNAHLREIVNRFEYYQIIFHDNRYEATIKDFKSELNQLLNPILEKYHEYKGEVCNSTHLKNAELFKNRLPLIIEKYNDSICRLMSENIIFK